MRRSLLWLLLAPALLPAQASTAAVIASEPRASKLAAYGGYVAWSHWDTALGRFRLATLFRGRTEVLPIAPSPTPFDVSLGPDNGGRTVAVYSRCAPGGAAVWVPGAPGTQLTPPRGCRIYQYSFLTRQEERLAGVKSSGSLYLPSRWHDELAYARLTGGVPQVVAQPLHPAQITIRRAGKPPRRRRVPVAVRALPGGQEGLPGPVSLSLHGASVALDWLVQGREGTLSSSVLLDTLPGRAGARVRSTTIDSLSAGPGAPGLFLNPMVLSSGVLYGQFDGSPIVPSADSLRRADFAGDPVSETSAPHALRSMALDGTLQATLSGPYSGDFSVCGAPGCTLSVTRR